MDIQDPQDSRPFKMPKFLPFMRLRPLVLVLVITMSIGFGYAGYFLLGGHAQSANVTINFDNPVQTLDPYAFSSTISTYGQNGGSIAVNQTQRDNLGNLNLGLYRVPLQWNSGNIISSASGGPSNISGDTWVNDISGFGGTPMIVIGGSTDDNFTSQDAADLVNHFNGTNGPLVNYWVVGNEPDNNGMTMSDYCTLFDATYDAMKAIRSNIYIGGPAWSHYDATNLQSFLTCAGSRVDFIDFHDYAMGSSYLDSATALSQTMDWGNDITAIRQMINQTVPSRSSQIAIQVGEYNWSWQQADGYPGYNGDDRFFQSVVTVWAASVAGSIAEAGGRGNQYSDQNGALGLTFEKTSDATYYGQQVDSPMPIYFGLEMFTGGNLFRHFGTQMVQSTTTLSNVDVFASANSDNAVLINKDPSNTQNALVQLNGVDSGTADIWQTDSSTPFAAPIKVGNATISGGFVSVTLPPYSVTTLVITPSSPSPTPTVSPSTSPSPTAQATPEATKPPMSSVPTTPAPPAVEPSPSSEATATPVYSVAPAVTPSASKKPIQNPQSSPITTREILVLAAGVAAVVVVIGIFIIKALI
jgi:Glycosyl hydrolases family 39